VPPCVPPLVQSNRTEVDDVGQSAVGTGAKGAGRHHSLAPPSEIEKKKNKKTRKREKGKS